LIAVGILRIVSRLRRIRRILEVREYPFHNLPARAPPRAGLTRFRRSEKLAYFGSGAGGRALSISDPLVYAVIVHG
jgi:hypothetical protein